MMQILPRGFRDFSFNRMQAATERMSSPDISHQTNTFPCSLFSIFFRSARASCTTSGGPAPARAMKIWTPIYRHICLMNHQETPQTNPLAIWDPLDVSLNPLGPGLDEYPLPDPNFYFATRTRPELFLKISEFRFFPRKLFPSRLLQIFLQKSSNSIVF